MHMARASATSRRSSASEMGSQRVDRGTFSSAFVPPPPSPRAYAERPIKRSGRVGARLPWCVPVGAWAPCPSQPARLIN